MGVQGWPAMIRALLRAEAPLTIGELMECTGSTRDSLQRQLHKLEPEGVLVRTQRRTEHGHHATAWALDR